MTEHPTEAVYLTRRRVAELYDIPPRLVFSPEELAPWGHGRGAPCDEKCVCPVHGTALLYSPAGDKHACQDVDCRHGHGMVADA